MKYNHVIETLRCRCRALSSQYYSSYDKEIEAIGASRSFIRYRVTDEMSYKLGMLIDREYQSFSHLIHDIRAQIPVRLDLFLAGCTAEEDLLHIQAAEDAVRECLARISPDCSRPNVPYERNIVGEEADAIISRFRSTWGYDPVKQWYPVTGGTEEDKLFIMVEHIENYMDEICRLIGLPENRMYTYGEGRYPGIPACSEVEELIGYGGCEIAYTDKDFRWIIYFSHEQTVTFAGSILPGIQKILKKEREHWNKWELF